MDVSSIQSISKLWQMAVSFLNDSHICSLQEYSQFHIYDKVSRPQW